MKNHLIYSVMPVDFILLNQFMAISYSRVVTCKLNVVKEHQLMARRIGIYSGTFDPVHAGHIAFALQALQTSNLDLVYFLPERRPRSKKHVEHFAHRVAMLKQASKPHPKFKVLELVDTSFSVERTLPKLNTLFEGDQLVFLFGSDIVNSLPEWSKSDRLLKSSELIIGLRDSDNRSSLNTQIEKWQVKPKQHTLIDAYAPDISSSKIREALQRRRSVKGILRSVERYSNRHWLYISLAIDNT